MAHNVQVIRRSFVVRLRLPPGQALRSALQWGQSEIRAAGSCNTIQETVYSPMDLKPLAFVGNAREQLRAFPVEARRRAGFELDQVQRGLSPTDWKPMPSVGSGVVEIRIHTGLEHRVFYVARFPEAVYVLHAFEKKRQKTSKQDIELGRARLAELLAERRRDRQ